MTGFARSERSGPWGTLAWELRAVNHRYLEIGFRLPEDLRGAEAEFRQALAAVLRRGKVDCSFTLRSSTTTAPEIPIDRGLARNLLTRASELAAMAEQANVPLEPCSALELLRWPGVVQDAEQDITPIVIAAREALGAALKALDEARAREGERIAELIEQRCKALLSLVAGVVTRLPEVRMRIRQRLTEKLAQLQAEPDQTRLEQELLILAQKMDVDEELDRLKGHVAEVRQTLASPEPAGRRLDFLMQELNREANTLSSKSQDLETTRAAVDMKVAIDQMREQIQNVE